MLSSSFIVLLIHITCCYSLKLRYNYTLTPLAHGYYFSNNPKVNWYTARKNCLFYKLELASVFDQEDYTDIQDAFLIHPIWDSFIGEAQGLFTSAVGAQPYDANKFAWESNGTNHPMINYPITKTLWAPKQPDNADPLEQCTSIFLLSDEDVRLGMSDIQCGWLRGFLCEIPSPPGSPTHDKNYTKVTGPDDIVVLREATWANAVQECARRNTSQPILSTQAAIDSFIKRYYDAGYLKPSEAIWTSASSLGDVSPADLKKMPNARKFRWPDHRYYEEIPAPQERCLAFSKEKGLFEESCLKKLTFVCKKPDRTPCHEIAFDTIHIDKRTFYYSNHSLMSWSEALVCCASREERLVSIATPIVGNLLSNYFQKNKLTVGRHTGFKYGVWTSGMMLTEYGVRHNTTFEFASSYERINLSQNGVDHYMQGPKAFSGDCLQFVIDDTLTHTYVVNNISCEFFRSFVCEEGEKLVDAAKGPWLGHPDDSSVVYINRTVMSAAIKFFHIRFSQSLTFENLR